MRLRRLRSGTLAAVRLRPWWPRLELWVRRDVAGHALGCRMLPTQQGDHGPGKVACDCYASVWRRWSR